MRQLGRDAAQKVMSNIQTATIAAGDSGVSSAQINARAQMLVDGIARSMMESVERFEQNPQQEVIAYAVRAFREKLQEMSRQQGGGAPSGNDLGVGPAGDPDSIPPHLLPDLQQAQINEVIQHQREAYLCEREWKQNRSEYVNSHKSSVLLFADLIQAISNLAKPYLQGLGFANLPGVLEQVIEEPEVKRQLQRSFAMRDDRYVTDPNTYVRTRYLHAVLKDLLHKPSQDLMSAGVNITEAAAHRLSRRDEGKSGSAARRPPTSGRVPPPPPRSGGRSTTSPAVATGGDLPLRPRARASRSSEAAAAAAPTEEKKKPITPTTSPPPSSSSSSTLDQKTEDVKSDTLTTKEQESASEEKGSGAPIVDVLTDVGDDLPELELTEDEKARAEATERQQSEGNHLTAVVSSLNQMATRLQKSSASKSGSSSDREAIASADQKFRETEAATRQKLKQRANRIS